MKKILTVLLAVMCLFSLAACDSKDSGTSTSDGTVTIKIGASGPISGDAKVYGDAVYNAAKLAVDEINASDSKIKFELRFEDDEATAEKASSAYDVLYDWRMQVSLFTVTSGAGAEVASKYDEDKIFAITPSGSSPDLVYTSSSNFRGNFQMCFTDPNQGIAAADYMAEHFADKKIGIIYKSDDVYSSGVYEKFLQEAEVKGLNIVYKDGAFTKDTETEFNTQLQAAQNAGADLVFLPVYYQPASKILIAANSMNYAPLFFGVDGMDGILNLEGFNTELAEGLYLLTPFAAASQDEKTVHFVTEFEKNFGGTPNQFAADAYDCVYAILQALNNIGVENVKNETLYEDLIAQFTTMTFDGTTGTNMKWSENGEVSKAPRAVVVENGTYVVAQ